MDRNFLYRSYGNTLERILDTHNIKGDRHISKKLLHKAFKAAKGIKTLTKLSNQELAEYIDEINDFFPITHLTNEHTRDSKGSDRGN